MPDFMLELAKGRRSIRKYTEEPIAEETLDAILKTALLAPSSWGEKVVEFVVVEDKEVLRDLARCKRIGALSVRDATVAVVVIVDRDRSKLWIEDGAVAATYLLLAAEYHGIGACWNHIRGREGQNASSEKEIQKLLGIPEKYGVLCVVAMGHKDENKAAYTDADIPLQNIHRGTFHSVTSQRRNHK
ncbi:nitroreductase [Moorella sp. E308F]|uniref:nitroreductase family protein n=1 Tax=Moorella sp. E308F TaxID=2572682 RepID=UPI0010FFC0F9|nr:nitroreductase family protein [Moorella sp. E308F]GEA16257.1 nitroreductase [Moorella sp. E308F]